MSELLQHGSNPFDVPQNTHHTSHLYFQRVYLRGLIQHGRAYVVFELEHDSRFLNTKVIIQVLQDTLTPVGYTDSQVGYMGFANGLTGNLAAILGGYFADRVFVKRMKAGILFGVFGIFGTSMVFLFSVPCFLWDHAPMPTSLATLIVMMALNGLFYGITSPLFYELSAELIYPQKEGLSAGTLVFVLNAVTMVVIGVDAILSYRYINFIYGIIIGLLLLVLFSVKEEYRRPRNKEDSHM